jgi:hypothetical protein
MRACAFREADVYEAIVRQSVGFLNPASLRVHGREQRIIRTDILTRSTKPNRRATDQTAKSLCLLHDLRSKFDKASAERKLRALTLLDSSRMLDPQQLLEYHDLLAFMRAYPDNPKILAEADRQLIQFEICTAKRHAIRMRRSWLIPD